MIPGDVQVHGVAKEELEYLSHWNLLDQRLRLVCWHDFQREFAIGDGFSDKFAQTESIAIEMCAVKKVDPMVEKRLFQFLEVSFWKITKHDVRLGRLSLLVEFAGQSGSDLDEVRQANSRIAVNKE